MGGGGGGHARPSGLNMSVSRLLQGHVRPYLNESTPNPSASNSQCISGDIVGRSLCYVLTDPTGIIGMAIYANKYVVLR